MGLAYGVEGSDLLTKQLHTKIGVDERLTGRPELISRSERALASERRSRVEREIIPRLTERSEQLIVWGVTLIISEADGKRHHRCINCQG